MRLSWGIDTYGGQTSLKNNDPLLTAAITCQYFLN